MMFLLGTQKNEWKPITLKIRIQPPRRCWKVGARTP